MSEILTVKIEPQPDFPLEDLTDDNADFLQLMLANRDLLGLGHDEAERFKLAFGKTHPSVNQVAERMTDPLDRQQAINHGVITYEAMSVFLSARDKTDARIITYNSAMLVLGEEYMMRAYIETALEVFRSKLPRATEVIALSSKRFYRHLTEYAVLGAALTRQLEIDAID